MELIGIVREDLFIILKLYFEDFGCENVVVVYEVSLFRLGLKYLDLYLVYWLGMNEVVMVDIWKGMEDLYKNNNVKNIGVSNFEFEYLEVLLV